MTDRLKTPPQIMPANKEWNLARIAYHRRFQEVVQQMGLVAELLRRIGTLQPTIAILSVDILPDTSEAIAKALINLLVDKTDLKRPEYITRRKSLDQNVPLSSSLGLSDSDLFSRFDLIFVLHSSSNISLLNDIVCKQKNYKDTLFFASATGVTLQKMRNTLKSKQVITPFTSAKNMPIDCGVEYHTTIQKIVFEKGFQMRDLQNLLTVCVNHLVGKGFFQVKYHG